MGTSPGQGGGLAFWPAGRCHFSIFHNANSKKMRACKSSPWQARRRPPNGPGDVPKTGQAMLLKRVRRRYRIARRPCPESGPGRVQNLGSAVIRIWTRPCRESRPGRVGAVWFGQCGGAPIYVPPYCARGRRHPVSSAPSKREGAVKGRGLPSGELAAQRRSTFGAKKVQKRRGATSCVDPARSRHLRIRSRKVTAISS